MLLVGDRMSISYSKQSTTPVVQHTKMPIQKEKRKLVLYLPGKSKKDVT